MSRTPLRSGVGALAALCALAAGGPAAGQTFVTFNANGDTYVLSINAGGAVVGSACGVDSCNGYVRAADGTITTFYGPTSFIFPTGINRKGSITGIYFDNTDTYAYSFLRKPGGQIISFGKSGAAYAQANAINNSGVITGTHNSYGFLRAADGTITKFQPHGALRTVPTAINENGDIAGYYWQTVNTAHGFLRMADGTITSFDIPNASVTQAWGINRKDAIVGSYSGNGTMGGFERTPGSKIKTFTFDGSTGTQASGINDKGQITGFYTISQAPYGHSFVGSPKSGFTTFDVPNGVQTQANSINDNGVIAGSYYDAGGLNGFLRMP